jgi:DNA-binding FrmR family transcriptional regulator
MTSDTDHRLVTQYLRQFDAAAGSLSNARRAVLREEIANHLRELVQPDLSDADASAALSSFGSPADILGQELDVVPSLGAS